MHMGIKMPRIAQILVRGNSLHLGMPQMKMLAWGLTKILELQHLSCHKQKVVQVHRLPPHPHLFQMTVYQDKTLSDKL